MNEGRPFALDALERVSFNGVPLDRAGFPDTIRVGKSPFVPRGRDELLFSSETGTGTKLVGTGLSVSRLDEALLLPSRTGTEGGRSVDLG